MVFTGVQATGPKVPPGRSAASEELVILYLPVLLQEDLEALAAMPQGKAGQEARRALLHKRLVRIIEW
jgi:hypothetical protein